MERLNTMVLKSIRRLSGFALLTCLPLLCEAQQPATAAGAPPEPAPAATAVTAPADWGIEIQSLRLSAGGYVIDFRYKVVDPEKAAHLLRRESQASLIDQATGRRLGVPKTPKLGSLRVTAVPPRPGITCFVLFANPGQFVKAGQKVTVVIGDFKVTDLVVQ